MIQEAKTQEDEAQHHPPGEVLQAGLRRLEFAKDTAFQTELRRRVDELFFATRMRKRDCWQMYAKSAIILAAFGVSWWMLVFLAQTLAEGLILAVVLGLSTALIGLDVQHDGGHGAYSEHLWINRIAAGTMGLIGGSSYTWRWKHAVIHQG
jgi:linoleoyl-CoA desaturase